MDRSTHRRRVFTAVSLLALLALAVGLGGWYLFAAVLAASVLALAEFYQMIWPVSRLWTKIAGVLFGAGLIYACRDQTLAGPALILGGSFWFIALVLLLRFNDEGGDSWHDLLGLTAGLVYVPLTLQFFFAFSRHETILVLLAAMVADTAAYYAGSLCGKRKLWPEVSPKKTWMGLFGGILGAVAVVVGYGFFFGKDAAWPSWAFLGLALGVAASLGDLFESALKRRFGSKDSGALLPGHGGMLDRIDGLLLATACYALARMFHAWF